MANRELDFDYRTNAKPLTAGDKQLPQAREPDRSDQGRRLSPSEDFGLGPRLQTDAAYRKILDIDQQIARLVKLVHHDTGAESQTRDVLNACRDLLWEAAYEYIRETRPRVTNHMVSALARARRRRDA